LFQSVQAAVIQSPASSATSPAISSSSAEQLQSDALPAATGSPASSSLLLVAAAQKLLHEQQRADSLSKANRDADAEIAALRASVHEQQQHLQQLHHALAAAGIASPSVAVQPAASEAIQAQKEQYMSARDQILWEEQQRSIRCCSCARNPLAFFSCEFGKDASACVCYQHFSST
jgi:hypothetical protein